MPSDVHSGSIICVPVVQYDNAGNIMGIPPVVLKADITNATADTNVVTVVQAGIKKVDLYNMSPTQTLYIAFGSAPAAGNQIVIPAGKDIHLTIATSSGMQYKSSAAGGILSYVLSG
jgi:hypothetical protein